MQVPSADPTASQVAQANEVHERLLSGADETERTIIELRQHGYPPPKSPSQPAGISARSSVS